MLLSNPKVVSFINTELVPCWESVRQVPKVTIDFGDGRLLKRTLQGNTVIYLCLPNGQVIDAFPGVYTPEDFLSEIGKSLSLLREHGTAINSEEVLRWHKNQVSLAIRSEKMRITFSKAMVESPLLKALGINSRAEGSLPVGTAVSQTELGKDLNDPKAAFEALSRKLEDVSKQPSTVEQLRRNYLNYPNEKQVSAKDLGRMAVEIDSKNNIAIVRPAVHLLFANYQELPFPSECRDVIYKRILHVPIDDPYLGLTDALVPGSPVK